MDQLPVEFQALADKISFVRMKTENEYSASCPQCKGEIHSDGSWPDRFILWRSSKYTGRPFAMCRKCGYKWSSTKQDANWTPDELQEFVTKRAEMEREYAEKLARKLDELAETIRKQAMYERFHEEGMKLAHVRDYWDRVRHVPEGWQVYLKKGYIQDYTVKNHLAQYHSPVYVNPVWTLGGRIENMKLRVENPIDSNDRFRNYYKSGCQHLYTSEYEKPLQRRAVLLEGENKCDAITICGFLPEDISVLGVQSKQPEKRVLDMLKPCEVVYIAFDPDAYEPTVYYDSKTGEEKKQLPAVIGVAKQIGLERVRYVIPPRGQKFDDSLFQGFNFKSAVNMAVKALQS